MQLRRVDPHGPGFTRQRRGRGWSFLDERGQRITDPETCRRVRSLAIPPAWRDVWICPRSDGHMQAVGTDDAGRRQYRYHEEWRRRRDAEKHDRVLRLARRLPQVRQTVSEQLAGGGLTYERVLAAAVRMLDIGVFRVGGEEYAPGANDDEGTFGLATIRREHVARRNGAVVFRYPGKGGTERAVSLRDPALHSVVGSLLRRRDDGEDLLAYRVGRSWHDVRAEDVNTRLKQLAGDDFSAKDLRTWNATVLAAVSLADAATAGVPGSKRGRTRMINTALDEVAEHLGNTRAVARSSYVDPRVLERFAEGRTVLGALQRLGTTDLSDERVRAEVEQSVLRLLR